MASHWDPATKNADIALSGTDNSVMTGTVSGWKSVRGILGNSSGLLYFELVTAAPAEVQMAGFSDATPNLNGYGGSDAHGWTTYSGSGNKYHSAVNSACLPVWGASAGNVVQIAINFSTGSVWFGLNGTWVGDPVAGTGAAYTGLTGTLYPCGSSNTVGASLQLNVLASEFAYTPPSGYSAWATAGPGGITGTLDVTQVANGLTSSGAVAVSGSLSATQAPGTLSASGKLQVKGALARTQASNTLSATGSVASSSIIANLTITQASQTAASAGSVSIHGTLSAAQAAQSLVSSGGTQNAIHGTLSAAQDNNALAALGAAVIRGALAGTQAANTLQASGSAQLLPITGQLAVTQAPQTLQSFCRTTVLLTEPNRSNPVVGDVRRGALPAEVRAEAFQPERRTARLTA